MVSFHNCTHWHTSQYLHNSKLSVTCCRPSDPRQIIKPDTRNSFWWKYLPFNLACEKKKWIAKVTIFLLMSKMLKLKSDVALKLLWHFTIQKISLSSYAGKIKRSLRERITIFQIAVTLLSINACILSSLKTGEKKNPVQYMILMSSTPWHLNGRQVVNFIFVARWNSHLTNLLIKLRLILGYCRRQWMTIKISERKLGRWKQWHVLACFTSLGQNNDSKTS